MKKTVFAVASVECVWPQLLCFTYSQITVAYVTATTSAVITAIGLKNFLAKVLVCFLVTFVTPCVYALWNEGKCDILFVLLQRASPLMQRFVPFAAVAAANMVNIPLTRQRYTSFRFANTALWLCCSPCCATEFSPPSPNPTFCPDVCALFSAVNWRLELHALMCPAIGLWTRGCVVWHKFLRHHRITRASCSRSDWMSPHRKPGLMCLSTQDKKNFNAVKRHSFKKEIYTRTSAFRYPFDWIVLLIVSLNTRCLVLHDSHLSLTVRCCERDFAGGVFENSHSHAGNEWVLVLVHFIFDDTRERERLLFKELLSMCYSSLQHWCHSWWRLWRRRPGSKGCLAFTCCSRRWCWVFCECSVSFCGVLVHTLL